MAKLIPYQPDTSRKLGFRKVRKDITESESQLNLFQTQREAQILRHLDPFERGLQLDEKNDQLAEKLYLEAIRNQVSVADAYCNLGIIYARRGDTAAAIDCFTKTLVRDPRHTASHYNLGNMYYDAGNYQLARTHYEVALHMEDAFPEIVYNLALTCLSLDHTEQARFYLREYLSRCEDHDKEAAQRLLNLLENNFSDK